jgi:hypothetical protein
MPQYAQVTTNPTHNATINAPGRGDMAPV